MKEQLITFETAKLAKEKGFNYKVRVHYGHPANPHIAYDKEDFSIPSDFNTLNNSRNWKDFISAPTQSLLQKWLRDKHKIEIDMISALDCDDKDEPASYQCFVTTHLSRDFVSYRSKGFHLSYEDVLELALQEALKLIKL